MKIIILFWNFDYFHFLNAGNVQGQIKISNTDANVILSVSFEIGICKYISSIRMESCCFAFGSVWLIFAYCWWVLYSIIDRKVFAFQITNLYWLILLKSGKNLEYGLKEEGLLSFVRELNGNEEEAYDNYLRDASMYARGAF